MNKADFISLIEQPESLGAGHIAALKNIATDFPYFQSAQVLLTKALYNEQHYEFEKQLKYASLMVPDRAVLFRYIHNMTESAVQALPNISEPVAVETLIQPETTEKEIIAEAPEQTDEIIELLPETIEIPEPAMDIIEAIVPEDVAEPEPEAEPLVAPQPVIDTPAPIEPNETHSFAEWLQLQAAGKVPETTYTPQQTEVVHDAEPELEEVSEPVANTEAPPATTETTNPASNVVEFESILDKFIRENPRITRGKAEFYSPVNMAKQSVEQDEELVSETLANIYYKQGHYKKAIRVYEKLCLLYPHKLSYFADLIQKIKTENKD